VKNEGLDGLPAELKTDIERYDPQFDDATSLGTRLVDWLEGQAATALFQVLDHLRQHRMYPLSLHILEAAWNSDLPVDRLGRVAEDWIGTVLYGLGDRRGAKEVAEHISAMSEQHGPAFQSDLGHLLLQWEFIDTATPLVETAAKALPGDMSAQFNLGVIKKLETDWAASAAAFETVLRFRPDDQACHWNLGIAYTALGRFSDARLQWQKVGIDIPETDGDYASEGELVPIRLRSQRGGAEVIWARRLCPARVRLKGIPLDLEIGSYNDEFLIDGIADGETTYQGEDVSIFNSLALLKEGGLVPFGCVPKDGSKPLEELLHVLNAEVIPHADWRRLMQVIAYPVVVALPEAEGRHALFDKLDQYGDWIILKEG